MNSPTIDAQHREAVEFWSQVARAWMRPDNLEARVVVANQARQAIQGAMKELEQLGTRKQVKSLLQDLLDDDEE